MKIHHLRNATLIIESGENFILVEELHKSISDPKELKAIAYVVSLINDLVAKNATKDDAFKVLTAGVQDLVNELF